ncbi:uncharacterized protein LOC128928101 isoform X2 [Callithrix jacchus]
MPHLTRLNLQPHGTGSLPTPSDPESSGKSSPECPPEDRSEAPSSSSTGPEQEAGLKEVLRSGESGSRAACGTQPPSPGSPREPPPAFSSAAVAGDKSAGIAAGQPGTPMHLRERRVTGPSGASQARGLSRGWRHSYCPRGPGNGFGGFAKQVPTAIVAAVLRFQEPGRAEPGLETLRLSFRDAQGDPQGTPRCFRPAQTVWECVSLKAVSAGISTYGQPVCRGAGLSPRVFPAEGRTAEAVGCLCVLYKPDAVTHVSNPSTSGGRGGRTTRKESPATEDKDGPWWKRSPKLKTEEANLQLPRELETMEISSCLDSLQKASESLSPPDLSPGEASSWFCHLCCMLGLPLCLSSCLF